MTLISPIITRHLHGFGTAYTIIEAVLSIVFCSLVIHGLKTSNHKLILPSLVYIPINTTAVMFEIAIMWFVPWFSYTTWKMAKYAGSKGSYNYNSGYNYGYEYYGEYYYHSRLVALVAVCGAVVVVLLGLTLAPWIAFYRIYKFFKHGQNAGANQGSHLEAGIDIE